ncbi:MAG: protein kinase [Acidobacteria bacterium]|nr:protein kinase [Acidobacteriota bacterium]
MSNAKTKDLVGQVIDNKYELISQLGIGGMAVVYNARRLRINDEVAVKILHPEITLDSVSQMRFEREAQAAARIKHPNIVTIHDFGTTTDGLTYLVMELLQGPTLGEELSDYNGLTIERTLSILLPVCQAIGVAHQEGIIHRDLKPSNILLHKLKDGTELVKVVDFGIVKVRSGEALTQVNNILGTPHYMSPEQCYSRELDARSDIYSLAIIGYEMLVGRLPFNEPSIVEILQAQVEKAPPPLRQYRPDIPTGLEAAILRALSKKAEDRPSSAQEFAQELFSGAGFNPQSTLPGSGGHIRAIKASEISSTLIPKSNASSGSNNPIKETINRRLVKLSPDFDSFVGRKRELERLVAEYQSLTTNKARPVIVLGEKGFGISRLGEKFYRWLKSNNVAVLLTKFYEPASRAQLPFQPWLDLLRRSLGIRRQDLAQESDLINITLERTGIKLPKCLFESRSLDEAEKWSIFEAIESIIIHTANDQRGILIFDNLEYANVNLELLSYLIRNLHTRTLFVFLGNTEKVTQKGHPCQEWLASLSRSGGYETIKLQPLTQAELRTMLDGIFGKLDIAERDIEKIWQVSLGNPYYVVEIIRYLINEGKITLESNWACENIDEFILPESLQQLAEIKLSKVDEPIIELLRQASVIGNEFSFDILEKVTGLNEDELANILEKAVKARLLQESVNREEIYNFSDPAIHFVLYDAIPRRRKRKLHLQVAQAIETIVGNSQQKLLRYSAALLHHFYEAGETAKTFYYGRAASEAAFSRLDIAEAEKYYLWALNAAKEMQEEGNTPNTTEQAQLYLGSARIALHLGHIEKAQENLTFAQDIAEAEKNLAVISRTQLIKSQIEYSCSNFELALKAVEAGLSAAQSIKDPKTESRLLLILSQVSTALGQTEKTLKSLENNLALSRQNKDPFTENQILSLLGSTFSQIGNFKQGLSLIEEGLKIARNNKDRLGELKALRRLGNLYKQTKQLELALETYDCGLELARSLEAKLEEGLFENGRGDIYRQLGEIDLARECYQKLLSIARLVSNSSNEALANHKLALVALELGVYSDSVRKLKVALEQHTKLGELRLVAQAYYFLGYAYEQLGQLQTAQDNYQLAIDYCERINHPTYQWQAHYGLGNTFSMFGLYDQALAQLNDAKEIINRLCKTLPDNASEEDFMKDKLKVFALIEDIKQHF